MNKKAITLLSLSSLTATFLVALGCNSVRKVDAVDSTIKNQVAALMGPVTSPYNGSYYNDITATGGSQLFDQLTQLTSKNYTSVGYSDLATVYKDSDMRPDNTVWDIYGDFSYKMTDTGNYSSPGDSWNKEHLIPQSWFGEATPMKSDAYHIYPSDGKINGWRDNYPLSEVDNSGKSYTFNNYISGTSKLGQSTFSGIDGTCFEPADCYKGDFARSYFYFATRYASIMPNGGCLKNGSASSVFTKSKTNFYLTEGAKNLFLKWHKQDPVSQKEVNRANGIEKHQKNRNPYIDHPEYVEAIWSNGQVTPVVTAPNLSVYMGNGTNINNLSKVSGLLTIEKGATFSLLPAIDNIVKSQEADSTITHTDPNSSILSVTKYYYNGLRLTALEEGTTSVTFTKSYLDNNVTKQVSSTVNIKVVEEGAGGGGSGGGNQGGTNVDAKTITINKDNIPTSYNTSEITVGGVKFAIYNVANFDGNIQFKKGGSYLRNVEPISNISKIKVVELSGKANRLTIGLSNDATTVASASKVSLTTEGVDCTGYSYFYITNEQSNVSNIDEIIIEFNEDINPDPIEKDGGCSGSIASTSLIISIFSSIGLGLLLSKKQKHCN